MPDAVTPPDPGLLSSVADQISLPGYAVRNLIRGDLGAAGRNLADFGLNLIDAPLPGDLIPEISGEDDRPETSDILGIRPEGFTGSAINLAGNILTDPLTYVPGAWVAKGAGAAAKGASKVVPKAVKEAAAPVLQKAGKTIRRTFGAEKIGKPLQDVITRAQGAKDTAGAAAQAAIAEGLKGASKKELEAAGEVLTNIQKDASGIRSAVDETESLSLQDRLQKYLLTHPDVDPGRLQKIVQTSQGVGRAEWESGQAGNIFTDMGQTPSTDVVMGALPGTASRGIADYFPRIFKRETPEDISDFAANPSAIKERKLETTQDVLAHLAAHPGDELLTNVAEVLSRRAASQAELAARGAAGKGLFEIARAGGTELPDELLAKALNRQRISQPAKAVVGQSETSVGDDINQMLMGGRQHGPRLADPDIAPLRTESKGILGNLLDPEGSTDKWLMEQGLKDADLGLSQSGKSVVGKSANEVSGLTNAQRKQARDWLLSQDFKYADPLLKEAATAIAKNLPGDEADVALTMLQGMKQRGAATKILSGLNKYFKPYAVYGAIVPKLGSITRNMTGGLWQKYSNPEARGTISPANVPRFVRDWTASIEDGLERVLGKRIFTKNEFKQLDDAYKVSGGDPRKALGAINDNVMRSAAERGLFGNNFINTEELIAQAQKNGLREVGARLMDYPGYMFKGAEQRMRYALYKDLVRNGKSYDDAARIVRDSFYDYNISSAENRLARDVIPFFQFMAKSIPQQAKLMAEKPALASTIANTYAQGRDEPVMPNMEGKLNLPIGTDKQGNRQFITNLGLPFESLSVIPNLSANPLQTGRDVEQGIVSALHPLLKMPYRYISGQDPYFGSLPGSYQKVAGQDLGATGGAINELLASPVPFASVGQSLLSQVGRATDERQSPLERLIGMTTGVRTQSVDPSRAIRDRLQALLERDPSISSYRDFYAKPGDEDALALLQAYQDAKANIKAQKKAQANVQ